MKHEKLKKPLKKTLFCVQDFSAEQKRWMKYYFTKTEISFQNGTTEKYCIGLIK